MKEIKSPGQDRTEHGVGVEIIQKKRSVCRGQGASHLLACVHVCVCMRVWGVHVCGDPRALPCRLWPPAMAQHAREAARLSPQLLSVTAPPCSL